MPPRQRLVGRRGHAGVARRDRRADRARRARTSPHDRGRRSGSRSAASRTSAAGSWSSRARVALPKPTRQTNVSFSRQGVIRGLHYHERGQDDLFVCLQGMARVVVLDRETRRDVHRGHRRREPGRGLHPRAPRARLRGAHRSPLLLPRDRGVRPRRSRTSTGSAGTTRASKHLWSTAVADPLAAGPRRVVLVTGAGGQLGRALAEEFAADERRRADARGLGRRAAAAAGSSRPTSSCTRPPGRTSTAPRTIRRARPPSTSAGRRTSPSLGAPLVYYSTDYVFDGRKREPYVESDGPNPLSAYGRTKLHGEAAAGEQAWIVRSSWLFGPTGHNFVRTMLRLGAERDEVAVVDDQRGSPTYVGHLAAATREVARAPVRRLPRRGRGRVHVGRLRRGDLRGGRARHAACAGSRPPSSAARRRARLLGAPERERARRRCRTGARACARRSPPSARRWHE